MTYVPSTEVNVDRFPDDVAFEDLSVDERSPKITIKDLKLTDFVRYAGASGDFNPLHYDSEFVRDRGYDGVFAMGMLSAGFLSHLVTKWLGLRRITYFKTKFESLVWPGDDLILFGVVEAMNPANGLVECRLVVENQHGEKVITGEVHAEFAD